MPGAIAWELDGIQLTFVYPNKTQLIEFVKGINRSLSTASPLPDSLFRMTNKSLEQLLVEQFDLVSPEEAYDVAVESGAQAPQKRTLHYFELAGADDEGPPRKRSAHSSGTTTPVARHRGGSRSASRGRSMTRSAGRPVFGEGSSRSTRPVTRTQGSREVGQGTRQLADELHLEEPFQAGAPTSTPDAASRSTGPVTRSRGSREVRQVTRQLADRLHLEEAPQSGAPTSTPGASSRPTGPVTRSQSSRDMNRLTAQLEDKLKLAQTPQPEAPTSHTRIRTRSITSEARDVPDQAPSSPLADNVTRLVGATMWDFSIQLTVPGGILPPNETTRTIEGSNTTKALLAGMWRLWSAEASLEYEPVHVQRAANRSREGVYTSFVDYLGPVFGPRFFNHLDRVHRNMIAQTTQANICELRTGMLQYCEPHLQAAVVHGDSVAQDVAAAFD